MYLAGNTKLTEPQPHIERRNNITRVSSLGKIPSSLSACSASFGMYTELSLSAQLLILPTVARGRPRPHAKKFNNKPRQTKPAAPFIASLNPKLPTTPQPYRTIYRHLSPRPTKPSSLRNLSHNRTIAVVSCVSTQRNTARRKLNANANVVVEGRIAER